MRKEEKYTELAPIVKGSSFSALFDFLYKSALLRYTTKEILNEINSKFGTPKKLDKLTELGFFIKDGAYTTTLKTRQILKDEGYNTDILQKTFTGTYTHEIAISKEVLRLMTKDFYSVFYPNFTYLIPDACIIYRNEERSYRISFLEVENEKAGWTSYLMDKRDKYLKLATDYELWDKWWRVYAEKLKLPFCDAEDFCFSVLCVGGIKYDWEGWQWFKK